MPTINKFYVYEDYGHVYIHTIKHPYTMSIECNDFETALNEGMNMSVSRRLGFYCTENIIKGLSK